MTGTTRYTKSESGDYQFFTFMFMGEATPTASR